MLVESTALSEPLNEPLSVAVSREVYVPAAFAVNDGVKVVALESVDPAGAGEDGPGVRQRIAVRIGSAPREDVAPSPP